MRFRLALLLLPFLACARASDPDAPASGFGERTVVLMYADSAQLEEMRAGYTEEELATVGDDMMWYRAEAARWFEERGIPVVWLEGRRPLSFLVDGEYREFDFSAHETIDVVVLYDRNREPVAVAPIDAPAESESYFGPLAPVAGTPPED